VKCQKSDVVEQRGREPRCFRLGADLPPEIRFKLLKNQYFTEGAI
jgi:hypothetical protein